MYRNIIIVGIGSLIGGIFRYVFQTLLQNRFPSLFPLGTFLVNITGCFVIGILYALAEKTNLLTPAVRLFFVTGFCGGYTTFSSFAIENVSLFHNGHWLYAALYMSLSVFVGIGAAFLGVMVGNLFTL